MGCATQMAKLPLERPAVTLSRRASAPVEVVDSPDLLNRPFRILS